MCRSERKFIVTSATFSVGLLSRSDLGADTVDSVIGVDLSNLVLSARQSIGDHDWWPHFGELLRVLDPAGGGVAAVVGSHSPPHVAGWVSAAGRAGFEAASLPRGRSGEKGVDGLLQAWALIEMSRHAGSGHLTLVSGDADHLGLLGAAREMGWSRTVAFFPSFTAEAVREQCDEFIDLTAEVERLRFRPVSNRKRPAAVNLGKIAGRSAIVSCGTNATVPGGTPARGTES